MVQDEPKLLDDAGENNQISRRRLAVQFPAAKSPLYLIGEYLLDGQLPLVLWHSLVGVLPQKKKKKKRKVTT